MVGGFHLGFWSLSISSARTPSKKSWSGRMAPCDMRYSIVIESSNERLAQRLSCSSVIAMASGESLSSAASCLSAHSPPCFLSLATISATDSAEKQRSMSGIMAGRVGMPASAVKPAITASALRLASGPERSAAPSAACRSFILALGTWASTMPAHTPSAIFSRWLVSARNAPSAPCRRVRK